MCAHSSVCLSVIVFPVISEIDLSYNGYKLNSHLTCFRLGFMAQSVEHCASIVEVMGSNPVGASEFVSGLYLFLHNCKDLFHLYSLSAVHSYDLYHTHFMSISEMAKEACQYLFLIYIIVWLHQTRIGLSLYDVAGQGYLKESVSVQGLSCGVDLKNGSPLQLLSYSNML